MLVKTSAKLNPTPSWGVPLDLEYVPNKDCMKYFDQNGYDLTPLEQEYAKVNNTHFENVRWRNAIKRDWFTSDAVGGVHLNHADLYERKGYHGYALEQISGYAEGIPAVYKLMHMKPKWGIDISIDYVDQGKAFEVFHYEWDDFDYARVAEKQAHLEELVLNTDWEHLATVFWDSRTEWMHLDFDGQSRYKTNYLGIEPERFKLVAWTL